MAVDRIIKVALPELDTPDGDLGRASRGSLELETGKHYSGGIRSHYTVFHIGECMKQHQFSLSRVGKGDASGTVKTVPGIATQRKIDAQHADVFTPEVIEEIRLKALAHYGK